MRCGTLTVISEIDFFSAFSIFGTRHEAPGLAVFLVAVRVTLGKWTDLDHPNPGEYSDWEYVPNVVENDVGDEEVNFFAGIDVGLRVAEDVESVSMLAVAEGGFDLHPPGVRAVLENKVVAVAVAPRLGDAEAEGGGFVEEGRFGKFSPTLRS